MDVECPLIAVLDDEPVFCKVLARLLKTHGYEVAMVACPNRATLARLPGRAACRRLHRPVH